MKSDEIKIDCVMKRLLCEEFEAMESKIDAQYFGVASAKVVLKKACTQLELQCELLDFLNNFEFITIINKGNDPSNNRWLGEKTNAFLTDMNIQLTKEVSNIRQLNDECAIVANNLPENDKIIEIAETSFVYSRFYNDPYLSPVTARNIYVDITRNAFTKLDSYFVLINEGDITVGFLLFSIDKTSLSSTIKLLATDRNHKRRGLGSKLINILEGYLAEQGIKIIKVGTQIDNVDATNFYNDYGFKQFECNSIYHYWPLRIDLKETK